MGKKKNKSEKQMDNVSTEGNRMIYYDRLHFVPVDEKNERWAAEVIYFNKNNSKVFVEPAVMAAKRDKDRNIIDEKIYKKMVDEDGAAEYFSADWKGNPIFNHINNIVEAKIEKLAHTLGVKAIDEISKSNLIKENDRILGQNEFREFINEMNKHMGFPALKKGEDPYAFVRKIETDRKEGKVQETPMNMLDNLKAGIDDNEGLQLFNEFLWKDGVEIACELGIDYYLFVANKFMEYSEKILRDIRLSNKCFMSWYTSETTGTPLIRYYRPEQVHTSEYEKDDLSDVTQWWVEEFVTFGDFIRMCGADLTPKQLQAVFERNIQHHGINDYDRCGFYKRNAAKIMLGYTEFESQDLEVYSDFIVNGNQKFRPMEWDWYPTKKEQDVFQNKRVEKNYNVWRSAYYIPPNTFVTQGSGDFDDQAKFIFKLQKIQDQQRFGDDLRYSKNSIVATKSDKMSFHDVIEEFMPQIHLLWNQTKNDFANAMPSGLVWYRDFLIQGMMAVDNNSEKAASLVGDMIKKIKQTGTAMSDVKDVQGNPVLGADPFKKIETGFLDDAAKRMQAIMNLYIMMTRALGISETAEGVTPPPRSSFGGVTAALEGTNNSTFFIEKFFKRIVVQFGERMLSYIIMIVNEKDSARLKAFQEIVGKANGMALESIKDIPFHSLGMYVEEEITDEQRAYINNIANQMAGSGLLSPEDAIFIATIKNPKQAYAILRLKSKQKRKEDDERNAAANQFQLDLADKKNQFELQKQEQFWAEQTKMRVVMGDIDAKLVQLEETLKLQGQSAIKDQIKTNRIDENYANKQLEEAS